MGQKAYTWLKVHACIAVLLFFTPAFSSCGLTKKNTEKKACVSATTDKENYTATDAITLTFVNNCSQEVFSHISSHTPSFSIEHIERFIGKEWRTYKVRCEYPNCTLESDAPVRIEPGQKVNFSWTPVIHPNGTAEKSKIEPGEYRLILQYLDVKQEEWKLTTTNNFHIN